MTRGASRNFSFIAAGALGAGMGLYHFWLPAQFGWGEALSHDPMLHWALLSINTFFSYLLLAGGVLTIAVGARKPPLDSISTWLVLAMTGFWLLNTGYQAVSPMPLPARLAVLRWVLFGFALTVLALYAIGLRQARRTAR